MSTVLNIVGVIGLVAWIFAAHKTSKYFIVDWRRFLAYAALTVAITYALWRLSVYRLALLH